MNTPLQVFEANLKWADGLARAVHRRIPPSFDLADLEQEARIKLWDCCQRYDASTNVPFRAYAYIYVRGAVLMSIRRRVYANSTLEELYDTHIDPRSDIEGRIVAEDKAIGRRRQVEHTLETLANYAPDAVVLLRTIYLEGDDARELADRLGIPEKELAKTGKRAARVVRRHLDSTGGRSMKPLFEQPTAAAETFKVIMRAIQLQAGGCR